MRILYVSKALVVGAYQRKMEELAALPGIELHVGVPPAWRDERGEQLLERAHLDGYRLWKIPLLFSGSFHCHFYPRLGRLLDTVQPDLLHMDEEAYNLATGHAAWLARRRTIPFVFFTWQNLVREYPLPFSWIERAVYGRAAHAIAGNRDAASVLREKDYAGPITVIPQFGIDPAMFHPAPQREQRPFTIGYAGRFVEEKGLFVLLAALAQLPAEPAWRCVLQGSGPLHDTLQARIRERHLEDRVEMRRPVPSTAMPAFYHSIDVLVLPSLTRPNWQEQFGRVLVEAMACGVPVIASDSGEIPYVIGDAGGVVPEGNATALRDALCRLMHDDECYARLADAGRERAVTHFTQAQIARQTWEVYRQVLGE